MGRLVCGLEVKTLMEEDVCDGEEVRVKAATSCFELRALPRPPFRVSTRRAKMPKAEEACGRSDHQAREM